MPEGHTLHRIARAWRPLVGRQVHASSPQGRFVDGAQTLDGRTLEDAQAYGKHLLASFGDAHLHVHLGMAGSIFESEHGGTPGAGIRLRLAYEPIGPTWDVVAPTRCELLGGDERARLLGRLGPDPLRADDPEPVFAHVTGSPRPIGLLLLDQTVVAGVGNVFRAEVLHHCRIHPERPGASLSRADLECLWGALTRLMERATEEGRIITVEAPPGVDRATIDPAEGRNVYKQDRCRVCGTPVRTWALGNRTAYACETCQPPP